MDKELIIKKESGNDGSKMHLHYDGITGEWLAFGLSAYSLRLFCKSNGYACIRSWSKELSLPCTVAGGEVMHLILKAAALVETETEDALSVQMPDCVDIDAYKKWYGKLSGRVSSDDDIIVMTPLSMYVPKNVFIADNMSAWTRNIKRIFDCLSSALMLLVFSPLFLFCWIAIRREDGGPAIYRQERIGRFGRPFYIYKFRSMRMDAEKMGPQLSHSGGHDDLRLTKIGKFIRVHHLDELPQLFNVFIGDMAFVGPRPERKFYIDQILEHDIRYSYLYQIRPGVTSYATLYNGYTDTMEKMLKRLEYDLYYLGHRTIALDVKILAKTFFSIVFGKKF